MSRDEFRQLLEPFVMAMRAEFDLPTWAGYYVLLQDVPPDILAGALTDIALTAPRFFPTAPEVRAAAERKRRQLLALNPWDGCAECEDQRGYRTVMGEAGQKTVAACPCKGRHLEKLAGMGLSEPIAALPGEATRESEPVFPTAEQLPATVRAQLSSIAGRKVLR